jgi:two-component system, response regulator
MRTILYVEDDPDDRKLMIAAMAKVAPQFALKVQSAYYETIDYLRHQPPFQDFGDNPEPDLVLLDYSLGTFRGTDLLSWIRTKSEFRAIPVVMFSGSTQDDIVAQCYALGADYFIAKPPRLEGWKSVVKSIDACLRSPCPQLKKLASLAIRPDLSHQGLRRALRINRAKHQVAMKKQRELRMGIDLLLAEAKELRKKFPFRKKSSRDDG